MRSYNIAIFHGNLAYAAHGFSNNNLRAINRVGSHNSIHVNHKLIYRQNGPIAGPRIIDAQLEKNQVDIVIFGLDNDFEYPIEFFSNLRARYFTVLYLGDDEHTFDKSSRYYSQVFDLVMVQNPLCVQRYELFDMDAILHPPAFDISNIKKMDYEKKYDVCFIGADKKVGRREYLNHLIEENIDVRIFGSGTSGGVVSSDEMNRLYGSSKIGLSFHGMSWDACMDQDITINRRMKQRKERAQEIALTGTFVLAEYWHGMSDFFEIGKEIDVFHSKGELIEKVKYYLKNEDVREEMAARAFDRAICECDEVNVWEEHLQIISMKLEEKKTKNMRRESKVYKDSIFKRANSSFHLFKVFESLIRGNLRLARDELFVYVKYPLIDGGVFLYYVRRLLVDIGWLRRMAQKIKG